MPEKRHPSTHPATLNAYIAVVIADLEASRCLLMEFPTFPDLRPAQVEPFLEACRMLLEDATYVP